MVYTNCRIISYYNPLTNLTAKNEISKFCASKYAYNTMSCVARMSSTAFIRPQSPVTAESINGMYISVTQYRIVQYPLTACTYLSHSTEYYSIIQ